MANIKNKSLMECLKWTGISKLPDKDDKENIWIYAIGLVQKADGSESYVALGKNSKLEIEYRKDFGNISVIRTLKEIYPYEYLLAKNMPVFKTKKREERIAYLNRYDYGKDSNLEELSLKDLDKMVIWSAIKFQLNKKEIDTDYEQEDIE